MKKTTLLVSMLAVMLLSAPAMAGEFYALTGLQGATPAPLQDQELAATEGGSTCTSALGSTAGGLADNFGVALCSDVSFAGVLGGSGLAASFSVFNQAPVSSATFLMVTGG